MKIILKSLLVLLCLLLVVFISTRAYFYFSNKNEITVYEITENEIETIREQVSSLKSDTERKEFLESIFKLDQQVRTHISNIVQEEGYKSKQHKNALRAMDSVDTNNLYSIKLYLQTFDYPNKSSLGDIASYTPLLVFHHKSSWNEFKEYYQYFRFAHSEGNISTKQLLSALERKHDKIFNKRYSKPQTPINQEEILTDITKVLGLD